MLHSCIFLENRLLGCASQVTNYIHAAFEFLSQSDHIFASVRSVCLFLSLTVVRKNVVRKKIKFEIYTKNMHVQNKILTT